MGISAHSKYTLYMMSVYKLPREYPCYDLYERPESKIYAEEEVASTYTNYYTNAFSYEDFAMH